MSDKKQINFNGAFPSLLTLVFVVMKCMGYIDWSWWLVFSPMLAMAGLTLSIIILAVFVAES